MTPNLEKLFAVSDKPVGFYSDREQLEIAHAIRQRNALLATHGRALIEALEAILAADARGQGLPFQEAMQRADQLLTTLETEAKGS